MADITRTTPRDLVLKRAEQRTAELNYAITRLEVRKMELAQELSGTDDTLLATMKTLEDHLASIKNI